MHPSSNQVDPIHPNTPLHPITPLHPNTPLHPPWHYHSPPNHTPTPPHDIPTPGSRGVVGRPARSGVNLPCQLQSQVILVLEQIYLLLTITVFGILWRIGNIDHCLFKKLVFMNSCLFKTMFYSCTVQKRVICTTQGAKASLFKFKKVNSESLSFFGNLV